MAAPSGKLEMIDYYWRNPGQWAIDNNNTAKQAAATLRPAINSPVRDIPPPTDPRAPVGSTDPFGDYLRGNPGKADAWAYLEALLNDYGLGSLASFVQDNIIQGRSEAEVVQRLRETAQYKTRFAAIEQRKTKGLPPISEAEVVAYERQATQLMRSAGLPEGFWDQPDDFVKLQERDISLAEIDRRVTQGYLAAQQAPPEVRSELERFYGVGQGDLAAFFLDPDRTEAVLMQRYGAAQRAGAAVRSGYGAVTQQEAEGLVAGGIGVEQTQAGFSELAKQHELFTALPGEAATDITREEQFGAVFSANSQAQQRINRRAAERVAAFAGGGGYASSREGVGGLGTAR